MRVLLILDVNFEFPCANSDNGGESINCGAAILQGVRPSQEDRILCMADIALPSFGMSGSFDASMNGGVISELVHFI